jgi:SAM-dependent methyltransferase
MSRWRELTGGDAGAGYASRFAELAAAGADVHGEARLCAGLMPTGSRVLDAGCGTGRVAIRLTELGYHCVGVDSDRSMLAEARRSAPEISWLLADLATLDLPAHRVPDGSEIPDGSDIPDGFDLIVAAGNVIPLLAPGTEPTVVSRLAAHLRPGGLLVAGFGLDAAHLPLASAPVDLAAYDAWCGAAGLTLHQRFATWDGDEYLDGAYAVSIHRHLAGTRAP